MSLQVINVGAAPNDRTGDPIREAFVKCNDNYNELLTKSEQLHAYGYEIDITSLSTKPVRVDPSGLGKLLPIQSGLRRYLETPTGGFITWLHDQYSDKKPDGTSVDLSGTLGNVMLRIPTYYRKRYFNYPKLRWMYSLHPLPGYTKVEGMSVSPWYSTYDNANNRAANVCSIQFNADDTIKRDAVTDLLIYAANAAQFRGGNNSATNDAAYNSLLGMARTNISRNDIRAKCVAANGHNGWYRAMLMLAELSLLEYANFNMQESFNPALDANGYRQGGLGSGPAVASSEWNTHNGYYPYVPSGVTVRLGNRTGIVNYKIKNWANTGVDKIVPVSSYRGLENWFEYLWGIVDDAYIYAQTAEEGGKVLLYACEDPTKFASPASDTSPSVPEGYILRSNEVSALEGYGKYEVLNEFHDFLPALVGASASQGLADYYYRSGTGWFQILLSGNALYGAGAGPRCASAIYRPANTGADCGFRLSRSNSI